MTKHRPDEMLIYMSYPIMDIDSEPNYINTLIDNTPDYWLFYRPILPLHKQTHLNNRLNYFIANEIKQKFYLTKQTQALAHSSHTVLDIVNECEIALPPTSGLLLMLKNLAVLAISDIVIVSCDKPSFGERSMELLWANILGIPTMGVTDRFVHSPWLQSYIDIMITNSAVFEELIFRGAAIDSARNMFESQIEEQEQKNQQNTT